MTSRIQPSKRKNGHKFQTKISPEIRTAIVAAVAAGQTQSQVAKDFGVSTYTVSMYVRAIKEAVPGPHNPLSRDWRERHAQLYVDAIDENMPLIDDPSKAVEKAQNGLTKLGLLGGDNQVQIKIDAWLSSPAAQRMMEAAEARREREKLEAEQRDPMAAS
jgi:hypothetical protein